MGQTKQQKRIKEAVTEFLSVYSAMNPFVETMQDAMLDIFEYETANLKGFKTEALKQFSKLVDEQLEFMTVMIEDIETQMLKDEVAQINA
jgi:hypothetical protein